MAPLSLRNEKRMLLKLKQLTSALYNLYPGTYYDDIEILKRDDLTFNQRNMVLERRNEKEILLVIKGFCEDILPIFDMTYEVI